MKRALTLAACLMVAAIAYAGGQYARLQAARTELAAVELRVQSLEYRSRWLQSVQAHYRTYRHAATWGVPMLSQPQASRP